MSKPVELREQTSEQLDLTLKDVQSNLFRLRLQSETERLEAPSEIVKAKRDRPHQDDPASCARSSRRRRWPPRPLGRRSESREK